MRGNTRDIFRIALCVGLASAGGSFAASAAAGTPKSPPLSPAPEVQPPIVLEAHVGARTPEAIAALAPVLDELERAGFAARATTVGQALRRGAPRPGMLDEKLTQADIALEVDRGVVYFEQGKFKEAEEMLSAALHHIERNPSLVVLAINDELLVRAMVHLARSQDKLKRPDDANQTMLELRRLSSTPPDPFEHGPDAERLYRNSQRSAQSRGRGQLRVNVSDSHAMVFLDNRYRGLGKVSLGEINAGRHSMLVQIAGSDGRQYDLDVRANETTELAIDWSIESTLHLGEEWAGFGLATEQDREEQAALAPRLARRWGRRSVIIVGPARLGGDRVLLGMVYPADGEPSGAFVPLKASPERLRQLARFLIDGTVNDGVNVVARSAARVADGVTASAPQPRTDGPPLLAPVLVTSAGVGLVIGSAGVYRSRAGQLTSAGDDGRDTEVTIMVGGAVALGGATYLWAREARGARALTAATLGAGVATLTAGAVLYLTDQDPVPSAPPRIRDSGAAGTIIGATGVVLTGVGLWMLLREPSASTSIATSTETVRTPMLLPITSDGAHGALVGYAGSF